ncbi:iron ABC transporter permease [Dehalococcoidia bacterium]|nr:iron ABC transporter permease [Dehalococcoidia bacterium]
MPPALFLITAIIVSAGVLLPIVYLLYRAADAGTGTWEIVARAQTFNILLRTAGLGLTVTLASAAIALPLAWITVRTDIRFRRIWSVLTVLPLVIPSYVGAFSLITTFGPRGLVQQIIEGPLGITRLPEIYGFPGAWLALTLFTYPYILLTVRAALWGMDPAQEEASRSLGRGPWITFLRVTLPQLRPALAAGSLLVMLYVLSDFGAVSLFRFDSFTRIIFVHYQVSFDRTLASVLALVLVLFSILLLIVEHRARVWGARYHQVGNVGRGLLPRVRLGQWGFPAQTLVGSVVIVALGLPAASLMYWLVQGIVSGESLGFVGGAIWNAVYVSALAAGVAVVVAIPMGVLGVRFAGRVTTLLSSAPYLGFAMPGIVVALALVFFGVSYATVLYQTIFFLIAAYVIRFLPEAIGSVRTSLIQVNPSVEEAARSLGRSPLSVLATVTVPLIRPGILVGLALVFLTAMKELPATLILSPIGFTTLATEMWLATDEAFFARAALPGLILIIVSAMPVALLLLQERRSDG